MHAHVFQMCMVFSSIIEDTSTLMFLGSEDAFHFIYIITTKNKIVFDEFFIMYNK